MDEEEAKCTCDCTYWTIYHSCILCEECGNEYTLPSAMFGAAEAINAVIKSYDGGDR